MTTHSLGVQITTRSSLETQLHANLLKDPNELHQRGNYQINSADDLISLYTQFQELQFGTYKFSLKNPVTPKTSIIITPEEIKTTSNNQLLKINYSEKTEIKPSETLTDEQFEKIAKIQKNPAQDYTGLIASKSELENLINNFYGGTETKELYIGLSMAKITEYLVQVLYSGIAEDLGFSIDPKTEILTYRTIQLTLSEFPEMKDNDADGIIYCPNKLKVTRERNLGGNIVPPTLSVPCTLIDSRGVPFAQVTKTISKLKKSDFYELLDTI